MMEPDTALKQGNELKVLVRKLDFWDLMEMETQNVFDARSITGI